jgi:hypothetical protein
LTIIALRAKKGQNQFPMFDKIKARRANLERETGQLKAELAEVKRTLAQVIGENHFLRRERDRIIGLSGIAPAFPVKRHQWPIARLRHR